MSNLLTEMTFRIGNDLEVNRLGYGAMRITGSGVWGPPENKTEAIKILKKAVDLGVNFIDTADSYGPNVSEELIAEALYPYPKDLVIATKGGFLRPGPNQWTIDASPKHLKKALEGSLKRLKLDTIDLYQLHRVDPKVPIGETCEFLKQAQQAGKIKHIGLSEVSVTQIQEISEYFNVVSVQNIYSIENRKWEEVLNYCEETNIGFIPWYPLNAGNVNGLAALQKIADQKGATVQQVALAWLLHRSNNILLIPGTSKVSHLEENVQAANITLTLDEFELLDKMN